jgi:hypothetical protein
MERPSDEILSKVRKLLALGESPSEAEAASALAKAQSLLARYGLSVQDVEDEGPEVVESPILEKKRLRAWESHLVAVVTKATFTRALHVTLSGASRVLIIGRPVNAAAAAELFSYLHLVVLKLGRSAGERVSHLESFKLGVVHRVGERLASNEPGVAGAEGPWTAGSPPAAEGEAKPKKTRSGESSQDGFCPNAEDRQLVVAFSRETTKENDAYIADKYGKTKSKRVGRRVEPHSFHAGRAAGDTVSLARQIAEPKKRRR